MDLNQWNPFWNTSQMGGDDNSTDMDMDGAEDSAGQAQEMKIPTDAFDDRDINYQIYTTEFDEIIEPQKLADANELATLRTQLDDQLQPLQALIGKLANRLQRILMALINPYAGTRRGQGRGIGFHHRQLERRTVTCQLDTKRTPPCTRSVE